MKRIFKFALTAFAAMAVFACQNKENKPSGGGNTSGGDSEDGVETLTYNVDVMAGSNEYVIKDIKADVLAKFKAQGISEAQLFEALGTYTDGTATVDGREGVAVTNQVNQTVDWVPIQKSTGYAGAAQYTCTGFDWFGWWFNEAGDASNWWNSVFAINLEFREADDPEADEPTYHSADQWNLRVWCKAADVPAVGSKLSYEMAFVCGDNIMTETEYYELHIVVNVNIVDMLPAPTVTVKGTKDINVTSEFIPNWGATSIEDQIDYAAIQSAIGISANEAVNYGVNADGSLWPLAASNNWYDVNGNVCAYGENCGIDINKDSGEWTFCFYPNEGLAGKTLKGAVAFVNPATLDAYVLKLTVVVSSIDYLVINVLTSYDTGETEYSLSENNMAAIAEALGVETLDLAAIGSDIAIKGVNADDSIYDGEYTANNGYWYSSKGDVTSYGSADFNTYIEYRGEGVFGCGLWGETGETNTVKLALVKGDKTAILTFNLEVDEQKAYETEEVGTLNLTATQKLAASYSGEVIAVDYEALCTTLGLTDDNFDAKFAVLTEKGTMEYTGEVPGFWFNADGEICEWGDDGSSFFLNVKYGEALPEGAASKLVINTGIRAEDTHVNAAGTFTGKMRFANVETLKHVTVTVTVTVTAE